MVITANAPAPVVKLITVSDIPGYKTDKQEPAPCGSSYAHAPHEFGEDEKWCSGLRRIGHDESKEDARRERHHARRYEKHIIRQFLRLRLTKVNMALETAINPDDPRQVREREYDLNRKKVIEWLMVQG